MGIVVNRRPSFVRRIVPLLASALLLCATLPAFALGLGQIVVKSKPGQPLVAEIPIITSDPNELQGLQAQLASPETFARVGLAPPVGSVADLDFSFDQDPAGHPLIRVTTRQPVQEPALTFLLEVDWGSGRLVREYSALIDAPQTVAAPAPEPLQMPAPAPADTVVRTPLPETPPASVAETPASTPTPVPAPEAKPTNAIPPGVQAAPPAPAPAPAPAMASAPNPVESVSVQRGDTLGRIARDLDAGHGYSLQQTMLALLRANPGAFIDGNVNLVKAGAVLRVPDAADFSAIDRQQAAAIVQQQVQRWRAARAIRAQPQPEAASATATASRGEAQGTARTTGARLEIAPPSSNDAKRAGTRSGIEAGGEGEMLRQELQQTKETLSARDAEVAELKSRVADLEKLQKEQQQLISMKDSALAGAQQDLAKARQAQQGAPPAQAQPAHASAWWPWLLLAVVAALLVGWWLRRRGAPRPSQPSRFDSASLAAAVPRSTTRPEAQPETPVADKPTWSREESTGSKPAPANAPAPAARPVWQAPQADAIAPLNTAPAGRERLELARAYLDMGDLATARSLLQEVAEGGDPEASAEAQRLLGGIA
jgi:pilus assembly protein FimV